MRRVFLLIAVLVCAGWATGGAGAATFVVNTPADVVPGGTVDCSNPAFSCSLRAAVMTSNSVPGFDTIIVPAFTFFLSRHGAGDDFGSTGDLDIRDSVQIVGAGVGSTIVDGDHADRVFDVTPFPSDTGGDSVGLSQLSIQNGATTAGGAGVQSFGALALDNVRIHDNSATSDFSIGGGVHIGSGATGTVTLHGSLDMFQSTVDHNVAASGAGIAIDSQDAVQIQASTIDHNVAWPNAGPLGDGGGIKNGGTLQITNSTIANNGAKTAGGGLINFNTASLTNVTMAQNGAFTGGSGIWNDEVPGTVSVANTAFNNTPAGNDCGGPIDSLGHNVDPSTTCASGPTDFAATPLLAALAFNGGPTRTMAEQNFSPTIDNGDDALCPPFDQRGVARPQGPHCDVGAYERKPFIIKPFAFLFVINNAHSPAYCNGEPRCREPIVGGEVRLFRSGPEQQESPQQMFEGENPIGSCRTDQDGRCEIPTTLSNGPGLIAILKYTDPRSQQTFYKAGYPNARGGVFLQVQETIDRLVGGV
jgi:hypothetical protein